MINVWLRAYMLHLVNVIGLYTFVRKNEAKIARRKENEVFLTFLFSFYSKYSHH